MKIRIIAFSKRGCVLAQDIGRVLTEHSCELYSKTAADAAGTEEVKGPVSEWTKGSFASSDAIVFIGAAGIAVRYIAPYLKSKTTDPAIVCIDDAGRFVIPLLSGHIGGANELAKRIAEGIVAVPVITTATDIRGRFAVDSFAVKNDLHIGNMQVAKEISSLIVDDKRVGLVSEVLISGGIPPELDLGGNEETGIFISHRMEKGPFRRTLKLTPRCHVLGIGCRRGTSKENIETFVKEVLEKEDISIKSVRAVASIDLKNDEKGLLEFALKIKAEPVFFSSDVLASLPDKGFTPSERVKKITGVDNVCERAAFAASNDGEIVLKKTSRDGMTLSIVREKVCLDMKGE
ncbi:MAG: cobalt-precorrin 5A hydrolase [Methanomassiliicoccaceae archaeon]|nr:cobalt-precorrin 5A hydrolase [Methanomassiliicoccaceae archaeon]